MYYCMSELRLRPNLFEYHSCPVRVSMVPLKTPEMVLFELRPVLIDSLLSRLMCLTDFYSVKGN